MGIYYYSYRVLKTSWGISIDIGAEITSKSHFNNISPVIEVVPGIWLTMNGSKLPQVDPAYLCDGIAIVSESIISKSRYNSDTLIVVHSLVFNLCDYQPEGLTAAIVLWAANALEFEVPNIEVNFNKKLNKYEFEFC